MTKIQSPKKSVEERLDNIEGRLEHIILLLYAALGVIAGAAAMAIFL